MPGRGFTLFLKNPDFPEKCRSSAGRSPTHFSKMWNFGEFSRKMVSGGQKSRNPLRFWWAIFWKRQILGQWIDERKRPKIFKKCELPPAQNLRGRVRPRTLKVRKNGLFRQKSAFFTQKSPFFRHFWHFFRGSGPKFDPGTPRAGAGR